MGRLNYRPSRRTDPVLRFTPHSQKQSDLIHSEMEMSIGATGTQWGKSSAGVMWFIKQLHRFTDRQDNFLIMAPTYKIMQQSLLPPFLRVTQHMGRYHSSDSVFELRDKRLIYFRTEHDPDSVVGIPRVKAFWLDEAGKVTLYFHENIQARAASIGARGMYTTSPYSRNWLFKDYINKPRPDVLLVQAASWENPGHSLADPEKRRKMRASMDTRRFEMLFGGEWGKQAGLVYDSFEDDLNICEPFRLPNGTRFYAGVDWGFTEPFVIVIRAVTPDNQHYQVGEFYKTGLTVPEQVKVAQQKKSIFDIKHFYCGHERPENIQLFNQHGLPSSPVPEKKIMFGTDMHYELIKTRRYKVFRNSCPYTLDEYDSYHYPEPEDLKPDDDGKELTPVGQNDHCMSANRFVTLRTYRSGTVTKPYVPDELNSGRESQQARLQKLLRLRGSVGATAETWNR